MHHWLFVVVLGSVAGAWAAAVVPGGAGAQGISLVRLAPRRGDDVVAWTRAHSVHIANKYGLGGNSRPSALRRSASSAPMYNFEHDSSWATVLEFGPQRVREMVVVDTGSTDLWIDQQRVSLHKSKTFHNMSSPFNIQYGSGQVVGNVGRDDVVLAGHTARGFHFGIAETGTNVSLPTGVNGIMGMAFKPLSTTGSAPLWAALPLSKHVFGLFMRREMTPAKNGQNSSGGFLTLNGVNASLFEGALNAVPVEPNGYWAVRLGGLYVGGHAVPLQAPSIAVIDSGTTLIGGPTDAVKALYHAIPGSKEIPESPGYYAYPCKLEPNVSFSFGTRQYGMSNDDFQVQVLAPENSNAPPDASDLQCLGSVFALPAAPHDAQWVIGGAFLKNVYTVFNGTGKPSVAFGSLRPTENAGSFVRPGRDTVSGARALDSRAARVRWAAVTAATLVALC
ncbi:cathepsin D [Malassezia sp. CBS 17886]|nr:cathepsin D [Malassezia sp. CBS 17886]